MDRKIVRSRRSLVIHNRRLLVAKRMLYDMHIRRTRIIIVCYHTYSIRKKMTSWYKYVLCNNDDVDVAENGKLQLSCSSIVLKAGKMHWLQEIKMGCMPLG
jgi:hypothetical protein